METPTQQEGRGGEKEEEECGGVRGEKNVISPWKLKMFEIKIQNRKASEHGCADH